MFAQVTDIKRGLRDTHRNVEYFQTTRCRALGEEIEVLAQDVTRHSWQSYKSALLLEEKLKTLESDDTSVKGATEHDKDTDATSVKEQTAQVYVPTGAQKRTGSMRRDSIRNMRITSSISTMSSESCSSNIALFPQSKVEVKRRIQQEEANAKFTLNGEDTVRQGSCDGASIAKMVMSGYQDDGLILPNLHYIKVHELRALIEWMANTNAITSSESISCVEKVLHCVQLLQTGCRYESLAVIFSRSPRQIKESCLEVMGALLRLHSETVNKVGGQESYMPLWKIWRKFEVTEGRAGAYYGFRWIEVAKVLVTLNLYIGRWRMQGMFATDGPTFLWGRFFVAQEGAPTTVQTAKRLEVGDSKGGCEVVDDDGTSTIRAVQSVPEPD
ncbi:hypothetical protein T440DRAFT_390284 [Plenodomus tracheiphilus IPT5]|uniref:Uncharacterized protein n=1 Tax=Plenodomus tracheiphilus IPT5 TaxID=1408161 RepID=A0A6A7BDM0_9PLEO|nr:hypothetical protein T440DRAFT_390284 [Plenodomus tracheiphilus IPT5]